MRLVTLMQLAMLCVVAGCGSQPKRTGVVLSYLEKNTFCIGCPSFEVELSEGGHVHYRCLSDCVVPGERYHVVPEEQFRKLVEAFRAARFFSISRTDPIRAAFDVPVLRLTYRDDEGIHEVVDTDRRIPRITDLENRMRVTTDVQRYVKPSGALYRSLLESGWDVNTVGPDQQNALFAVVALGDSESARFLLRHGSRVTDRTLQMAALGNDVNLFRDLLAAYGKLKSHLAARLLVMAAQNSRTDTLKFLIDSGLDVNLRDPDEGVTPLFHAVTSDSLDNLKLLLARGADVNARDESGRTPLWHAATGLNTGPITLLCQHGADVNAQDYEGRTALMHASDMCYTWDIRALLDAGADPRIADKTGKTVLQLKLGVVGDPKCEEARKIPQTALLSSH
jgi:ankyrin repeat protein